MPKANWITNITLAEREKYTKYQTLELFAFAKCGAHFYHPAKAFHHGVCEAGIAIIEELE